MVIPIGPPGAQHVLKVTKQAAADGSSRHPLRHLQWPVVPFVPFTKLEGDVIKGTH